MTKVKIERCGTLVLSLPFAFGEAMHELSDERANKTQVVIVQRLAQELISLLKSPASFKIVINVSSGVDRRVKFEVTRYIDAQ